MAEITKIKCNDIEYDIKDETARSSVTSLQSSVGTLTTRVNALETGGTGSGGSGDMTKAIYDTDEDGIVDNASKLGGQLPSYYAKASDIPTVPTKVSDLENDSGFITGYTETDPTVPAWAKAESKPTYTAAEVGAEASGAVSTHNTSSSAHSTLFSAKQNKITATGLLKGTSGGVVAATAGTDYAAASHTHVAANVTGLATVATSGKYSDLTEKPTIPTIYAYTVSLTAAGWSDKSQTVTAAHVTANNLVQVSPAESSFEAWQTAQIRCTAQSAGTLTFVCGGDAPTDAVTYNVVVTDGVTE